MVEGLAYLGQTSTEPPFEAKAISAEKLEEYLLSPENAPVKVPELDLSHPLKDYFISSSHNTYLVCHQLYGDASIEGYKTVLLKGCRCIEIDCWDGEDNEPKVVHGYGHQLSGLIDKIYCCRAYYF